MGIRISVLQVYLSHSVLFADPSRSIGCLSVRSVGDGLIRAESVFKWSACWCWIRADIPSTYTETEQALSLVFPRLPQNVSTLNKHPGKGILLIMIRERCVLSIKYENASKHSLIIHAVAGGAACLRKEHMCNELDEFFHFVETMTKRLWRRRRGWWWWRWKMQNAERTANHQVDGGENREYGGCCCCKERTSFAADLWFIILLSLYICAISPRLISTDAAVLCVMFGSLRLHQISSARPDPPFLPLPISIQGASHTIGASFTASALFLFAEQHQPTQTQRRISCEEEYEESMISWNISNQSCY